MTNSGDGTDDATMTFGGTVANINLAIATITWTSDANDDADATITVVTTDDGGASDTDVMSITVNSVNDAPANAGDSAAIRGCSLLLMDRQPTGDTPMLTAIL